MPGSPDNCLSIRSSAIGVWLGSGMTGGRWSDRSMEGDFGWVAGVRCAASGAANGVGGVMARSAGPLRSTVPAKGIDTIRCGVGLCAIPSVSLFGLLSGLRAVTGRNPFLFPFAMYLCSRELRPPRYIYLVAVHLRYSRNSANAATQAPIILSAAPCRVSRQSAQRYLPVLQCEPCHRHLLGAYIKYFQTSQPNQSPTTNIGIRRIRPHYGLGEH